MGEDAAYTADEKARFVSIGAEYAQRNAALPPFIQAHLSGSLVPCRHFRINTLNPFFVYVVYLSRRSGSAAPEFCITTYRNHREYEGCCRLDRLYRRAFIYWTGLHSANHICNLLYSAATAV